MSVNFRTSVADEDNIKAEAVVHEALLKVYEGRRAEVRYIADQRRSWDFEILVNKMCVRVDAKFDANYERYGRLPFEFQDKYPSGSTRATWGVNPGLDFIAIVPWTFSKVVMVPLGEFAKYIAYQMLTSSREVLESTRSWKWWAKDNYSETATWVTHGVAVPEAQFAEYLEMHGEKPLVILPTNKKHHRDSPQPFGRILINGVEQGTYRPQHRKGEVS